MHNEQHHIDTNFIPEGLEFREEYMHAALQAYRKQKRIRAWKRASLLGTLVLLLAAGTFGVIAEKKHTDAAQQPTSGSSEQVEQPKETSSAIDLVNDGEQFNSNGQSPAVESLEPTQDLSSKAVDMGDPMSSGVGLPGQLTNLKGNLQHKVSNTPENSAEQSKQASLTEEQRGNANNSQETTIAPSVISGISASEPPSSDRILFSAEPLAYRNIAQLDNDRGLLNQRPMIIPPVQHWSIFAVVGMKAWSDYAFNHSPFKIDGTFGLGVAYRVNSKWSAECAGNFFTISGNATPYTVVQRSYAEGFSETTYRYYTDRLYQAGASISGKYKVLPRQTIGVGWKTDYLLTADNRIETGSATSFENLGTSSASAKGYVQGFRTLQHSLVFSYEFALGRSKSLGAQYQLGLTDFTRNTYFGNTTDKNSLLSLYFRFKLH
jgi:hypothetical protein